MLGWFIFSFFMVALFCQDLRAKLIIPLMEEPIDRIEQVDFAKFLVALDSTDGIMLPATSIQLFTTLYPVYKKFNSKLLQPTNLENNLFANVAGLNNFTVIHDLVKQDLNKTRSALMIMKKGTYRGYLFWLKNNGGKFDLRLSPTKLDTRTNTEQFIMLHSKYHPYSEELNRFILRIEVSLLIRGGHGSGRVSSCQKNSSGKSTK